MMKRHLPFLLLVLFVTACKPKVPSQYLQPDEMEDLLYDYHVGQAMAKIDGASPDLGYNKHYYFQALLKKYNLTQADYDSSMVYYFSHMDRLRDVYVNVNERLADEAKSLGTSIAEAGRYSQYSASGDTANIWKGPSDLILIPRPSMNRLDFTVPSDSSFHKGDSFLFQFLCDYIWQSGSKDAVVCILSKYEGDSIVQTVNHVSVSGIAQVRIPANYDNRLKQMDGFIYLSDGGDDSDLRRIMFISQLQLIRFHNKEKENGKSNIDSNKKDSIQPGDSPGGGMADTLRPGGLSGGVVKRPLPVK